VSGLSRCVSSSEAAEESLPVCKNGRYFISLVFYEKYCLLIECVEYRCWDTRVEGRVYLVQRVCSVKERGDG
jgi:hypothetical protein